MNVEEAAKKATVAAAGIQIIASGGAGKFEHLSGAVTIGKASAVPAGSVFRFGEIYIVKEANL